MKNKLACITIFTLTMLSIHSFAASTSVEQNLTNSLRISPELEIGDIAGGIGGIRADIKNAGDADAIDVEWSISVAGGTLGRVNVFSQGTINRLAEGGIETVSSDAVLGLGNVTIKVTANGVEKTVEGFVFLIYVAIFPSHTLELEVIASGFNSPVVLTHAGDGTNRLFVADQIGIIYAIENENLLADPFLDISNKIVPLESIYDERGLLGMTFHPDYKNNGRFFVYYSAEKSAEGIDHESILSEFQLSTDNSNKIDPASEKIILRVDQPESNHNGGQIEFGPDGYLYIGLGDGGGAGDRHNLIGNGQNASTLLGSILRIDVDSMEPYAVPPDNPFVGTSGLDEIYAYGFRNPWKFSFESVSGQLIVADVGQDEWEELDFVEKGGNYGWRIMEGNHPYDPELADLLGIDIETLGKPFHEYNHAVGRSITGGYMYRGSQSPQLTGKYVFGDWSTSFARPNGKLFYLEEKEPGIWERYEFRLSEPFERFVLSFGEDENGEIYCLSKTTLGPTGSTGDVRKMIVN